MKAYYVKYKIHGFFGGEQGIEVHARTAAEAYDKAFYEAIPEKEGETPYSAWVDSVTYNNGNVHYFNTCEGLAY